MQANEKKEQNYKSILENIEADPGLKKEEDINMKQVKTSKCWQVTITLTTQTWKYEDKLTLWYCIMTDSYEIYGEIGS